MRLAEITPKMLADVFWIFDPDGNQENFAEQVNASQYLDAQDDLLAVCAGWLDQALALYLPLIDDGKIRLWRAVGVEHIDEVRGDGSSWSYSISGANASYGEGCASRLEVIIEAVFSEDAIDWMQTIFFNVYADNEMEVRTKSSAKPDTFSTILRNKSTKRPM